MHSLRFYSGFGCTVASELPLGGFDALSDSSALPDVTIRLVTGAKPPLGQLPDEFAFQANDDACFWIRSGQEIDVWLAPQADMVLVTDILLGTAFAILLFQRGQWPVHVSAVSVGGGVWLFSGQSGEGKSTLAAWLNATRGWTILSDDAGVVSISEGRVWFSPGARNLKLLPDALGQLPAFQSHPDASRRSDTEGKHHFRLSRLALPNRLPVHGFFDLVSSVDGEPATVTTLQGAGALQAARAALYRPWFGRNLCEPAETLKFCADVSRLMPMFRFARPRDYGRIAEINGLVATLMLPCSTPVGHADSRALGTVLPA